MLKQRIVLFILLMLTGSSLLASESIVNIYEKAKTNIDYSLDETYSDSLLVNDFDFLKFTYDHNGTEINKQRYFIIFFKDSEIRKISSINKTEFGANENYDVIINHTENIIFYSLFLYENSERELQEGFFINGFFINDKNREKSYYFELNDFLTFNVQVKKTNFTYSTIAITKSSGVSNIYKVLELNNQLKALEAIYWFDGEFVSHSKIEYHKNEVVENMSLYSMKTCRRKFDLNFFSVNDLYYAFNTGVNCRNTLLFQLFVDIKCNTPLWAKWKYSYKRNYFN